MTTVSGAPATTIAATDATSTQKQKYHHGNLREALFEAALTILARDGADALSMRTLAKELGVTSAAPYAHFKSKTDILARVAEHGFQQLTFAMIDAATGFAAPKARLEKMIVAFLDFSVRERSLFTIMFARDGAMFKDEPTLSMTAGKSYGLILSTLTAMDLHDEAARSAAMSLWAMMYGTAELLLQEKVSLSLCGARDHGEFAHRFIEIIQI